MQILVMLYLFVWMGILNIDLNYINHDDNNFDEDNQILLKKCKAVKKELNEKLFPVERHPKRWWDWCMSKDEKKRNRFNVYQRVIKVCVQVVYKLGVLNHFISGAYFRLRYWNILDIKCLNISDQNICQGAKFFNIPNLFFIV